MLGKKKCEEQRARDVRYILSLKNTEGFCGGARSIACDLIALALTGAALDDELAPGQLPPPEPEEIVELTDENELPTVGGPAVSDDDESAVLGED